MTINQILLQVRKQKTCSVGQVRRYLKKLGIQALGCRQNPQQFPEDAGAKILAMLGFSPQPANAEKLPEKLARLAKPANGNGHKAKLKGRVVSLDELQTIRSGGKVKA